MNLSDLDAQLNHLRWLRQIVTDWGMFVPFACSFGRRICKMPSMRIDPSVGRSEKFQETGTSDGGAWHGQPDLGFLLP
ncbi:MAG TPA: hypothetical protein VM286_00495 [Candidatus Thermoplasmatota archaeon]|nr:hypothetical protein [Candidatus Thermoplasmatota archaeon]